MPKKLLIALLVCWPLLVQGATVKVSTGEMAGETVNDLFHMYLFGQKGRAVLPPVITADFGNNLESLWNIKHGRGSSDVAKKTGVDSVQQYRLGGTKSTTLEQYLAGSSREIQKIRANLDWVCVAKAKGLKAAQLDVLIAMALRFSERDLLAYAMTELLPGRNGKYNLAYFRFLLRAAGEDYLHSIPALYDEKTSFGEYQFTEYALYDVSSSNRRGASIINACLSAHRVPGSVAKLRGGEHHRAAYLLAINSLADWVGKLRGKDLERLASRARVQQADVVQFVANAHNQTSRAPREAAAWVKRGMQAPYYRHGARRPQLVDYARKTEANRAVLVPTTKSRWWK